MIGRLRISADEAFVEHERCVVVDLLDEAVDLLVGVGPRPIVTDDHGKGTVRRPRDQVDHTRIVDASHPMRLALRHIWARSLDPKPKQHSATSADTTTCR